VGETAPEDEARPAMAAGVICLPVDSPPGLSEQAARSWPARLRMGIRWPVRRRAQAAGGLERPYRAPGGRHNRQAQGAAPGVRGQADRASAPGFASRHLEPMSTPRAEPRPSSHH